MEIVDKKSKVVASLFRTLDELQEAIGEAFKRRTPHLNDEKYLSNNEVSKLLRLSTRTLQDWRDYGVISYIQISGKILYRQSDILKLLEDNFEKSWREEE
ncbi:helix-turn-helix domain-containing protein [uncultured Bacteroides sp.]|uniref:helix-turn-helix domain-containing protein n=1 Tax=uncultured Bacteroides sp. TaxID=162156 RepID=UPI002AAC2D04|nr:helix-turn-helix domain-containing protein [uncultured Bacteroides sp.]